VVLTAGRKVKSERSCYRPPVSHFVLAAARGGDVLSVAVAD
jgi:hypothetical protein